MEALVKWKLLRKLFKKIKLEENLQSIKIKTIENLKMMLGADHINRKIP